MKNITVRGFSTFIKTLRKHILAGTYMNFWKEVHSKSRALVHANYTLAGTSYKIIYMNELINKMIELMPEISEQEMLDVISKVVRVSFLFESKYWFLISINDTTKEDIVVDPATIEVNSTTQSIELLPEQVSPSDRLAELKALSIADLRVILKERDIKYSPASKENKLIALILNTD